MIEELVDNRFNEERYFNFLKERFGLELKKAELKKATNNNYIKTYQELGSIEIGDIDEVGFFIVESSTPNIENIRVGFNDFIGNLIKMDKYGYDALIVAIFHPSSAVWRLSYVALELDEKRELSTKPKRFTFELGDVPTTTALQQLETLNKNSSLEDIKEAFSVEKLSDDFFREYKSLYKILVENILVVIKENRDEIQKESYAILKDELKIKAYIKKMLGRIVFLYFVQKKNWLNEDKKFLSNLFNTYTKKYPKENFYDKVLEQLFIKGLNKSGESWEAFDGQAYDIPYLNGGLFDADDEDRLDISIPNDDLKRVFDLFDSYNFTIIEDTPHDSEVAIDPEMLGRVFEDLLEDRKEKGAFYTPREIVHYMCQQSIKNYLETKPKDISTLEYIKQIKILDPAIGSGAFPMGMLHEIVEMRVNLGDTEDISTIKRETIQNSIYGVDIEPSAVEIAKLRFWLSIVVDEEKPKALPNLAYKIMVGNSLIETINGIDPLRERKKGSKVEEERVESLKNLDSLISDYYIEHNDKNQLREKITKEFSKLFKEISKEYPVNKDSLLTGTTQKDIEAREVAEIISSLKSNHFSDKIFLYKLFFRDVLNNGGFDVVIGNPPYVRHEKIKELKPKLKIEGYKSYNGTADLYIYFFEQGYRLLKENGSLSYITSNKYTRAKYGKQFREFVLKDATILEYIDFNGVKVFESATVDTSIFSFRKAKKKKSSFLYCDINQKYRKENELDQFVSENGFEYLQSDLSVDSFSFSSPEELAIKKRIEEVGIPLKDKEWDIEINRGILTGFNEAFIINGKTKDELIEKDPKSIEIIKPLLRGRDITRYGYEFDDKWLINSHNGLKEVDLKPININDYHAIKEHLDIYYDKLKKRGDKGVTPYNLRNCTYLDKFEKEKIVYAETMRVHKRMNSDRFPRFSFNEIEFYCDKSCFFITGYNLKYILSILNSKLGEYMMYLYIKKLDTGGFNVQSIFLKILSIPKISKEKQKPFEILVDYILFAKEQNLTLESSLFESVIDGMVYDLYFEEEMKRGGCFISDEVVDIVVAFDDGLSDEMKKQYILLTYGAFKENNKIQRGLIYSRTIPEIKVINGVNNDK